MSNDIDGAIVSYNWDLGDGATSAEIIFTHVFNNAGDYNVSLTVKDNDGATDTITKTISVSPNLPPRIISVPLTTATEGLLYIYDVEATDPDIEVHDPDLEATDPDIDVTDPNMEATDPNKDTLTYLLSLSPGGDDNRPHIRPDSMDTHP